MKLPTECCSNIGGAGPFKSCNESAKHWYLHNEDVCSFCAKHNYVCGYTIIWCRVGTMPAMYGATDQFKLKIELGDRFKVSALLRDHKSTQEYTVRCFEIKLVGERPLYMLEQF